MGQKDGRITIHRPTWKEQKYRPQRYVVAIMAFCGIMFVFLLRININIAIVAMVTPSNSSSNDDNNNSQQIDNNECGYEAENSTLSEDYDGEFAWDEFTQSLILASVFWGAIFTQLPGGRLADMFGARLVFGTAAFSSSILTLFIPLAANCNYQTLMVLRVLIGVSQGACTPSCHALISSWAPPDERSTLTAIIYSGSQAGTFLGYPLTTAILEAFGWEWVFYIQAAMALVWTLTWFLVVSDGPDNSRWITQVEKDYILGSIGDSKTKKSSPVPWRRIATSRPLWAIMVAGLCSSWGFFFLLTDLPLYMKEMLKQDITSTATLSSLPYVGRFVFSLIFSRVADALLRKGIVSTVAVRKFATVIACGGPAICLISLSFVECDWASTIGLLVLAITLQGGSYTGFMVNHIDIAPNFAGTLFGLTSAMGTIPSWLAPMTVGALTNGKQTLAQWRKVFYITATIYLVGMIFYLFFAAGEEQDWNRVVDEDPSHPSTDATSPRNDNSNILEHGDAISPRNDISNILKHDNPDLTTSNDSSRKPVREAVSKHDDVDNQRRPSLVKQDDTYEAYILDPYFRIRSLNKTKSSSHEATDCTESL